MRMKLSLTGSAPFFKLNGRVGSAASGGRGLWARAKRAGQVTVELLLVLPVFMLMIFCIMEIGGLAFQTILVHHCAYELARIGSLVADGGDANGKMQSALSTMFKDGGQISLTSGAEVTGQDPQSGQMTSDLVVTLVYPAKLVFPGSSYLMSDSPKELRVRKITAKVRMPIERPFFK
jgi:hypothetical protein